MTFYQITAILPETAEPKKENKRDEIRRPRREAGSKKLDSIEFNEQFDGRKQYFLAAKEEEKITAGLITKEAAAPAKAEIEAFLQATGYGNASITEAKEVIFQVIESMLRNSDRNDYIDDADDVMESFGLGGLNSHYSSISYGEKLLPEKEKKDIYRSVREYLSEETIVPELDRIYAKPGTGVQGHPVHYLLQTDDRDTRKAIYREVLSALYANGRLHNRRYLFLDLNPNRRYDPASMNNIYTACVGGCVVTRLVLQGDDDDDDDVASASFEAIERLAECVQKYRNEVLTILCLPRECKRLKEVIYQNLGTVCLVEMSEDLADAKRAKKFLQTVAARNGVKPDKDLYKNLKTGSRYLAPELNRMYDEWFTGKLKTEFYPQYQEIGTAISNAKVKTKKGSAYQELMEMPGLSEAKEVINKAVDYYKAQKLFKSMGMQEDTPAMHMIFSGNPGTAKTTAARLFAQIMKDNGLLSNGQLIECGRGDLVGKFVGWTAPTVKKFFERAKGGVLFIDEAYSLVDDRSGSYGDEAINTIVQEMENHRQDVVVIFAGYQDKMEEFLEKNPGLRSRIAFHVPFNDYSAEELTGIAELLGSKKGITFTVGAKKKMLEAFAEARKQGDFGNGRYVRNMLEKSRMNQASRLLGQNVEELTKEDVATITEEDLEFPAVSNPAASAGNVIGFAC